MFMALILLLVFMVQDEMFCSGEPVRALVGEDVVLPCSLGRELDPGGLIVEWSRPDLKPETDTVHIYRQGHDLQYQHPSYKHRTALFKEELKKGNVSLKLSRVRLEDEGLYTCFTSTADKQENNTVVQLLVGAGPLCQPEISILGQQEDGVLLQCLSHTWHPHPRLEWLDGQGGILPALVTSSQAGGTHTVSSNLTVQRSSSTVTCRVSSEKIDHMRETVISVPGEFFKTTSHVPVTVLGVICAALATTIIVWIILLVKREICWTRKTADRRSSDRVKMKMNEVEGGAGEGGQNHEEQLAELRREKEELEARVSKLQRDLQQLQHDLQQRDATIKQLSQQEVKNPPRRRDSSLGLSFPSLSSLELPDEGPHTPLLPQDSPFPF